MLPSSSHPRVFWKHLPSSASLVSSSILLATTTPVKNSSFPLLLHGPCPFLPLRQRHHRHIQTFLFPSLNSSIQSLPILPPTLYKRRTRVLHRGGITSFGCPGTPFKSSHPKTCPTRSFHPSWPIRQSAHVRRPRRVRLSISFDQPVRMTLVDHAVGGTLPIRPLSTPHHRWSWMVCSHRRFWRPSASDVQPQSSVNLPPKLLWKTLRRKAMGGLGLRWEKLTVILMLKPLGWGETWFRCLVGIAPESTQGSRIWCKSGVSGLGVDCWS